MRFKSKDLKFEVQVSPNVISDILHKCVSSGRNETGGLLAGHYSTNLKVAVIDLLAPEISDSSAGRVWFKRGTKGLQVWLDEIFLREKYYLGEWHYHPFSNPNPSLQDINQMLKISEDTSWNCPEPILLIVGGDPSMDFTLTITVFKNGRAIEFVEDKV
jgi:hypothetical protein